MPPAKKALQEEASFAGEGKGEGEEDEGAGTEDEGAVLGLLSMKRVEIYPEAPTLMRPSKGLA